MSQDLKSEEGNHRSFYEEAKGSIPSEEVGETLFGKFQRGAQSDVGFKQFKSRIKFKVLRFLRETVYPSIKPLENWICIIFDMAAIPLDFLFLYVLVVDHDNKCLAFDVKLGIWITVLQLLWYLFYTIIITFIQHPHGRVDFSMWGASYLDLPIPLPLLVVRTLMTDLDFWYLMKLVKVFVFLRCLIRAVRIYTKATLTLVKLSEATLHKAISIILLYIYMLAAHVYGALWYLMAIERETECWKKACRNHTECSDESFYCSGKLRDYSFLDGTCPTKTLYNTIYDFGIFHDALQSGIVEATNFPQKFLHCFLWGLRNLSWFGQNLHTSTDVWENLFVILITITSALLVVFFIGNFQLYLMFDIGRSKDMSLETLKMGDLMLLQKLPKNLQQQVRKYERCIWRKNKDDGVEFLFSNLPNALLQTINRELCLELLKKVQEFKMLNEERLEALCDNVKLVFYSQHTHIFQEGHPIDQMLFVVCGKVSSYTSKGITGFASTDHSRDDDNNISKKDHQVDCDFYGEELITWALDGHLSTSIPLSTRSVKALTNVEAFALMADDLKDVLLRDRYPEND
ncbi:cyclic nucleotide-gated ion channel 1-like [Mangifera indica]|uniref:cyclic nucleotide-gated ion channel 1-like n=1 Tax=Mangifera indica TaxID=29780 RepID=UPI001CFACF63|nr:cyclic nucleotide-gated ion channel 1-like [Mangifera indica]